MPKSSKLEEFARKVREDGPYASWRLSGISESAIPKNPPMMAKEFKEVALELAATMKEYGGTEDDIATLIYTMSDATHILESALAGAARDSKFKSWIKPSVTLLGRVSEMLADLSEKLEVAEPDGAPDSDDDSDEE